MQYSIIYDGQLIYEHQTCIPHVEVAGDPQAVAVSGKVVPFVHINSTYIIGHNLRQVLQIVMYCSLAAFQT